MNIDRQAGPCAQIIADTVYLLDVLVVIVYISHCKVIVGLLIIARGLSVPRAGGGGGGGGRKFLLTDFIFAKNVPGVLKRTQKMGGGSRKI